MGQEGAITFINGEEIRIGIYPVTVVKPNGAGDSFMAGLLAAIAEGRPLKEAVLRGFACASIVVSRPGCAPAIPTTAPRDNANTPIVDADHGQVPLNYFNIVELTRGRGL